MKAYTSDLRIYASDAGDVPGTISDLDTEDKSDVLENVCELPWRVDEIMDYIDERDAQGVSSGNIRKELEDSGRCYHREFFYTVHDHLYAKRKRERAKTHRMSFDKTLVRTREVAEEISRIVGVEVQVIPCKQPRPGEFWNSGMCHRIRLLNFEGWWNPREDRHVSLVPRVPRVLRPLKDALKLENVRLSCRLKVRESHINYRCEGNTFHRDVMLTFLWDDRWIEGYTPMTKEEKDALWRRDVEEWRKRVGEGQTDDE